MRRPNEDATAAAVRFSTRARTNGNRAVQPSPHAPMPAESSEAGPESPLPSQDSYHATFRSDGNCTMGKRQAVAHIHAQNCPFLVVTYNLSIGACQMPCVASRAVTPVQACQSYERKTHSCAITAPIHGSAVVGILRPSCNERAGPVQDWRDGTHGYQQPELTRLPLRLGEQKLKDLDKPKCERAAR